MELEFLGIKVSSSDSMLGIGAVLVIAAAIFNNGAVFAVGFTICFFGILLEFKDRGLLNR